MYVQTEITPNPNSLKFIPGKIVSNSGSFEITNKEEINKDILDERLAITQELLDEQQMEYNRKFITKTVKVLIDGAGKLEGQIKGKSEFNQSVALEGEENHIGQIISVQIKDVKMHSLIGERA